MRPAAGHAPFFYALSLYSVISMVLTGVQFLCAGTLVYLFSWTVHLGAFSGIAGHFRMSCYDSAGFAFLTASNSVLQYYLASALVRDLRAVPASSGVLLLSSVFSTMLFIRLSAASSFGAYAFAGVPMALSYLLGGFAGVLQKGTDNPFRGSRIRIFEAR